MNAKKIIIGTLLAGIIIWLVGMVIGNISADLYQMSPKAFWKPMNQTWMTRMMVFNFISAFALALVYSIVSPSLSGFGSKRGMIFGLLVFLVGPFLGLSMTYITMAIRAKLIAVWGLNSLINYVLAGAAFQLIDERIK